VRCSNSTNRKSRPISKQNLCILMRCEFDTCPKNGPNCTSNLLHITQQNLLIFMSC